MDDSNPHPSETPKKRRKLLPALLIGAAAAAGLTTAVIVTGFSAGAQTHSQTVSVIPGTGTTPSTSADTDIVLILPDGSTTPAPTPTVTPGSSSSATQTITNNSGTVKVTPKPSTSPKPTFKYCPDTREENPTVWDACRAGFVEPTIVAEKLVKCVAADDTGKNWYISIKYGLQGGNYRSYFWDGNNATHTYLIKGLRKEELPNAGPVTVGGYVLVQYGSMSDEYRGVILGRNIDVYGDFDLSGCR